jgi:hypothetical protein
MDNTRRDLIEQRWNVIRHDLLLSIRYATTGAGQAIITVLVFVDVDVPVGVSDFSEQ